MCRPSLRNSNVCNKCNACAIFKFYYTAAHRCSLWPYERCWHHAQWRNESDRTSINSLHHRLLCGTHWTGNSPFSPLKDTKFASIFAPPTYISVSKTLQQKTICCLSWKLGAAGCFAAQMTTKWGPVGVSTEHRLSSLSLMRQKWTVHMLTPLNLKLSPQPLQAGIKMAATCDR